MAIFTKKPAGATPPAAPGGGWLKLGPDCAVLRVLFDDARRSSAWNNPAFKAYTARITSQPLDLQMGPTERVQAPVVHVSAGGRSSMHGFHVVMQTAGRENLRRLSGSESVNARHFTPEDLKKIQGAAPAAPKPAAPAAKPPPSPARPAAPSAKPKPGGAADEFKDFFGAADKTKPSMPQPAATDLGGHLGGDLSDPNASVEEFQSYMASGRAPGEELPGSPGPAAAPMAGDLSGPDTDELMEAAELAEDIELSPEPSGTPPPELGAPGEDLGGSPPLDSSSPNTGPEPAGAQASYLDQTASIASGESEDSAWLGGGGGPQPAAAEAASVPPAREPASADESWLETGTAAELTAGGSPQAEEPLAEEPALAAEMVSGEPEPAAAGDAGEEDPFSGLGADGLSGSSESTGVEAAEEDAFAGLDAPATQTASSPGLVESLVETPEVEPVAPPPTDMSVAAISEESEGLPPESEPPEPAEVPAPSTALAGEPLISEPLASRDDFAAAEGTPPASASVSSAEASSLAGEAAEGAAAQEAERMASEVAEEPVPASVAEMPPESAPAADEPGAPSLGIQYAHDDIQYLGQPPDEGVIPEMARQDLDPTVRRARTETEESEGPVGLGDDEIEDAEDFVNGAGPAEAPAAASGPPPAAPAAKFSPAQIVEKPLRPASSGDGLIDFSSDSEIQQALSDASSVVMTTVERPGEESSAEGGEWLAFTKEASDALKARAKQAAVLERSADRLVFGLRLQVRFSETEQREGKLCIAQKRPALLCDGEQTARPLARQCSIRYLP